jgi:hypothetical protein
VIAWYIAFGEHADLRAVTEAQIEEFTALGLAGP